MPDPSTEPERGRSRRREPERPPSAYLTPWPKGELRPDTPPEWREAVLCAARLANDISKHRKANGWTARELARRAKVGKARVSDIENGAKWGVAAHVLYRIAAALNCQIGLVEPRTEARVIRPLTEG